MAIFKLSVVKEPPTVEELARLLADDRVSLAVLNGSDTRNPLTMRVAHHFKFLQQFLQQYHVLARGQEELLGVRKNALLMAVGNCDAIIRAITERLLSAGRFAAKLKQEYANLASSILTVRAVCDGKYNLLVNLEKYISDENMTDLMGAAQGGQSRDGMALREISGIHYREYFNPMHHYAKQGHIGYALFISWYQTVVNKREYGLEPKKLQCFPVYLEGNCRMGFYDEVNYTGMLPLGDYEKTEEDNFYEVVTFDGMGKQSRFFADVRNSHVMSLAVGKEGAIDYLESVKLEAPELHGYVLDRNEYLYVFQHKMGTNHHSSPTAGAAVLSAGMIRVSKGKITYIDEGSGHYQPTPRHLMNAVQVLAKKDVFDANATVMLTHLLNFRFKLVPLLAAIASGYSRDLVLAAIDGVRETDDVERLMDALTNPAWENNNYATSANVGAAEIDALYTNRPRPQAYTIARRARANAFKLDQARSPMPPLQLLRPLWPTERPEATKPSPTPAPSARVRSNALKKPPPYMG